MYAMYFNRINTYIYKTVVICNHFRLHLLLLYMFQWYHYPIMSTNFNHFAYLLMHSTHSSSMSPVSAIFIGFQILFVFNLLLMSFLLFQLLFASNYIQKFQCSQSLFFSSSFSSCFHAFAITHIEK